MGGCLPVHRAGPRAVIMAPAAEVLAATTAILHISTGRVGAAVLQSTRNLGAFILKQALQMMCCLPASKNELYSWQRQCSHRFSFVVCTEPEPGL